ncbi:MAG: bifunctional DNA-formamidopyrimidine glycosylase/DNA-(apurinic or apyrimidinic site) lyase [Victivallales bacterium]|nr:bifunctional DNA-formamidopyrimidine glycosylase/DNA-(apurinic or apyrimidinic site) lyase [Victivallales bacterium]
MPELPEVETIKNALSAHVLNHTFTKIEIFIDVCRYPLAPLLDKELCNHRIMELRRRGRYLIIELDNFRALIFHFGMSGSLRVVPADEPRRKHEHAVFYIDNGMTMRFDCPRRFGFIKTCVLSAPGAVPSELAELGVEPLSDEFTGKYLKRRLTGRKQKIKTAIMDNRIVVGVGNIYANESLFLSGISPLREAGTITLRQCNELVRHIRDTLHKAIAAGGTTIADFKSVDGSEGKFVLQLNIYGKEGKPCPRCEDTIVRNIVGGRSAFYCPGCQK